MKRRGRKTQVVDTNVAVVANRRNNESYACANKCAEALVDIKKFGVIVIDDADSILSEYRANCSASVASPELATPLFVGCTIIGVVQTLCTRFL